MVMLKKNKNKKERLLSQTLYCRSISYTVFHSQQLSEVGIIATSILWIWPERVA